MKVDALLTAAPKGEVRRDVDFLRDSHRWAKFFLCLLSYWLCSLTAKCLLFFCYNGCENRYAIISSSPERRIFWFAVLLNKGCITFLLLNPLWCAVLVLSVLRLSPRENEVFYDVVAIVDPLTRQAQKMSPLLIVSCILRLYCTPLFSIDSWYSKNTLESLSLKVKVQKHKACQGALQIHSLFFFLLHDANDQFHGLVSLYPMGCLLHIAGGLVWWGFDLGEHEHMTHHAFTDSHLQ